MDCKNAKALMGEYEEATLGSAEKSAFNDHLSKCEDCREYLRDWILLDCELQEALGGLKPARDFPTRIRRGLQFDPADKRAPIAFDLDKWLKPALVAALLVIVVGLGLIALSISVAPEPVKEQVATGVAQRAQEPLPEGGLLQE